MSLLEIKFLLGRRGCLKKFILLIILGSTSILGSLGLYNCAGKRLPGFTDKSYFIPPHKRNVYINEPVNLTRDFNIGIGLVETLRDYYKRNRTKMKYHGYKKADFILTLYLTRYNVEKSAALDLHGKNKLSAVLELQVDFIAQKNSSASTLSDYAPPTRQNAYLSRAPLIIEAESDDYIDEPSSLELIEKILYVKIIRSLEFYFKTGTLPQKY
ncbi:hypothetical protein COTS27_01458 [Spirochaetota bacterium]|nr:hypothetical protein COTS27_01458 [Spirochaetota bacterium]